MLKNEMESYVRIVGRGLKNLTYPYMGVEGRVNNFQNHPYVINEWPLSTALFAAQAFRLPNSLLIAVLWTQVLALTGRTGSGSRGYPQSFRSLNSFRGIGPLSTSDVSNIPLCCRVDLRYRL